MTEVYTFLLFILFTAELYISATMLFDVYTDDINKNRKSQEESSVAAKGVRRIAEPLSNLLYMLIRSMKLPQYSLAAKQRTLDRAGIEKTTERYYADGIALGLIVSLSSVLMLLLGLKTLSIVGAIMGVFVGYKELTKDKDALEKMDERIRTALPDFAITITAELDTSNNFPQIIKDYLASVPSSPLYRDLQILLKRIDTGEKMSDALIAFQKSINTPACDQFVDALIRIVDEGMAQTDLLNQINTEMTQMAYENMRREVAKRPGRMNLPKIAMLIGAGGTLIVPLVMSLISGAKDLF